MASLRGDLQSDDPLRQAAALLQLLNAMASGRDVGTAVTITCQTVVRGPSAPAVKRLAYDCVRAAALTDADWDCVLTGFLTDFAPTYPSTEVQVAAAGVLPLIPPHKLRLLVGPDGKLPGLVTRQISTVVKEVRAAALAAAGRWLAAPASSEVLATSPEAAANVGKWGGLLADGLLDPAPAAAAAAFDAVRRILGSTGEAPLEPGGYLRQTLAADIAGTLLRSLPAVLQRSRSLPPHEQVSAAAALAALLEHCSRQAQQPGAAAPQASGSWHVAEQLGEHFEGLLASGNPPLALEAAQALLRVCALARSGAWAGGGSAAVPAGWGPAAVAALQRLWCAEAPAAASLHTPLLEAIAAGIHCLQAQQQLALARRLFPMAAAVPSADARTAALAHVWAALVRLDLGARRAARLGAKGPAPPDLRAALTDAFLVEAITATDSEEEEPALAALREELVATLAETLLSHPQGLIHELGPPEPAAVTAASLAATARAAARAGRAAALADWLGAAKTALQGTKACLGWDRDPVGQTYACTAVTDSWLALLQRALQAAKALQAAPSPQGDAPAVLEAARAAAGCVGAFQELLDQLLVHWQALSSAVQPRALWVAAHHYALAPSMDAGWAHLLQALATCFGVQDDDASARRRAALRAAAAAGSMAPAAGGATIDDGEIRAEAMAVGLVAADRLASLLLHNAEVGLRPGLKEISAALVAILQPLAAPGSPAGPQPREHAARVAAFLTPLALAAPPSAEAGEAIAVQTEFGAKLFPAPDWPRNEGFPMVGPAGATLQATRRGARYWALKSQVQAAVAAAAAAAASGPGNAPAQQQQQPPQQRELPEAVGILEVMQMLQEEGDMGAGTVLTAPDDPLRLTAWHTIDRLAATATLQFEAHNQLDAGMDGVTIRLGLGGPVVPQAKQPPAYKLATLPAGEWVRWRFVLRVTGVGRITVQPLVSLPVAASLEPGDSAALRCEQYSVPLAALLAPPSPVPTPAVFFPAWPSLAAGAELTGVCRNRGAVGGLHALTALEGGPLARVYLQPLPAQGGFHAAFAGEALGGARVGLVLTAQLLPIGHPPPPSPGGAPVPRGHVVVRMSLRTTEPALADAVAAAPARWLAELFGRTIVEGIDADGLAGPGVPFRLHPSLIPIERLYAATAEAAPSPQEQQQQQRRLTEDGEQEAGEQLPAAPEELEAVDDAISAEWLRLRQLRLGAAA